MPCPTVAGPRTTVQTLQPGPTILRVVLRFDAGPTIGQGHSLRCAALAEALRNDGHQAVIALRGSTADDLHPHPCLLHGQPGQEPTVDELAPLLPADWLVLDHYGYAEHHLAHLRQAWPNLRILLIEDHQYRPGAHLRLAPFQAPAPDTLAGSSYILAGPALAQALERSRPRHDRWLVCLGGADPQHLLPIVVDGLVQRSARHLQVVAPSGRSLPSHPRIDHLAWSDHAAFLELLGTCAAALLPASTLAVEAMALGTPLVAVQAYPNQHQIATWLAHEGIPVFTEATAAAAALSAGQARAGRPGLIDGRGAIRVAAALTAWTRQASNPEVGS